jgi:hypothetical protein
MKMNNLIESFKFILSCVSFGLVVYLGDSLEEIFAKFAICFFTAILYLVSCICSWSQKENWKVDHFVGILWLINSQVQILLFLMAYLR